MTTTTSTLFPVTDTLPEPSEAAVQFFIEHAGYGYNPARETPEEGKRRGAIDLAKAEQWALDQGYEVVWRDDWDGDHSYTEQDEFADYEVTTCELAVLNTADGDVLAAMGCIDDATDEYRRVVDAELALEALIDTAKEV